MVSLTIFTVGRFPADGIFWVLEKILGPAVDFSSLDPVLAWNMIEIYLFMGIVLLTWFLILFIWEKLHFILSVEWILGLISWILRLKKSNSLYESERIYGPTKIDPVKNSEDAPTLTT